MIFAPALVPGSEPMRFVAVDARLSVAMFARPSPMPLRWDAIPAHYTPEPVISTAGHLFCVLSIGWEGVVFCADDDLDRLAHAVKVVERAILLLAWLGREHARRP